MTKSETCTVLAMIALVAGAAMQGSLLMFGVCGLLMVFAAHDRTREIVLDGCARALIRTPWRATLITIGALLIWQLVGVELALLMAGDVLAYVEVFVAVNLIAAQGRWRLMKRVAIARVKTSLDGLRVRFRPRAPRRVRAPRPLSPARDADDPFPARPSLTAYFSASVTALMSTYSSMPWIEPSRP